MAADARRPHRRASAPTPAAVRPHRRPPCSRRPPTRARQAGRRHRAKRRRRTHAARGESAEAGGDLERAEQAYWRAASIEAEPALRANYLVSHARVLLARGDVKTARGAAGDGARARARSRRRHARCWRTSATERRTGRGRATCTRCSTRRPTPPTSSRASCWCSGAPRWPTGWATRPRPRRCIASSRS